MRTSLFLFAALSLAACQTAERAANTAAEGVEDAADAVADAAGATYNAVEDVFDDDDMTTAAALVRPTSAPGSTVQGVVRFHEMDGGLMVMVSLSGLRPGRHGLHIHQNPACGPGPDGTPGGAAGGHWDPMGTGDHGAPGDPVDEKHLGDLGNVTASASGTVETTMTIDNFPVGEHDVAGHAVMVHQMGDDRETDPGGDAGTRVGCGVIAERM